jgi:hypothetical protein
VGTGRNGSKAQNKGTQQSCVEETEIAKEKGVQVFRTKISSRDASCYNDSGAKRRVQWDTSFNQTTQSRGSSSSPCVLAEWPASIATRLVPAGTAETIALDSRMSRVLDCVGAAPSRPVIEPVLLVVSGAVLDALLIRDAYESNRAPSWYNTATRILDAVHWLSEGALQSHGCGDDD